MRIRALCAGLTTVAIMLLGAPLAFAAPTATFSGGTLTVTGDATAETFTVSQNGSNVEVTGPAGVNDPDAGGTDCTAAGGTASCADSVVDDVVVNAGAGNDTLSDTRGGAGGDTDTLNGGADNDTLTQNSFCCSTFMNGGSGDDILNAGTGAFGYTAGGGEGNDTFNGSSQDSDSFIAEPGSDTYHGGTRTPSGPFDIVDDPATYQLYSADDFINYGPRTDALNVSLDDQPNDGSAGEGDNVGSDVEVVFGGTGNDTLTAGGSAVRLYGDSGDDALVGGPSDDLLNGGEGNDNLAGNAGNDYINDGDFTESIQDPGDPPQPAAGNDRLDGGAGNDDLDADRGADNLIGGPGVDDAFFARPIPQTSAVLTPIQWFGFDISLDDVANDGVHGAAEGDNVHSDVETIGTSRGADVVTGSANAESFYTGDGNDTINPGAGADIVAAGRGDDTINAVDQTTDRVDCDKGNDTATVDLAGGQPQRADVTIDCETIGGQAFPDISKLVLTLKSSTVKSKTFLRTRTLPVKVTCSRACSVFGEAFTTKARIATVGSLSVGSGKLGLGTGTRTLKVKIAKKYLKAFRSKLRTKAQRRKGIKFSVTVTVSDALGIQAKTTRTIKVRG
jgi:Ca2+-binding RTX toxin-like protein